MIKDFATINLFVIFILVIVGFGVIQVAKKRFEDQEEEMNGSQILGICETEGVRRIEVSFKRVTLWTLIFTNAFFIAYFFGRLLHQICLDKRINSSIPASFTHQQAMIPAVIACFFIQILNRPSSIETLTLDRQVPRKPRHLGGSFTLEF